MHGTGLCPRGEEDGAGGRRRGAVDERYRVRDRPEPSAVPVTAGQDSVRAAEVPAVLIKRRRTALTERCRHITK